MHAPQLSTRGAIAALAMFSVVSDGGEPSSQRGGGLPCAFSGYVGAYHIPGSDTGSSSYEQIEVDGRTAVFTYFSESGMGLGVLDVSDPTRPVGIGEIETGEPWALLVRDGLAYVELDGDVGLLQIFDLRDPAKIAPLGAVEIDVPGQRMVLGDGLLYLLADDVVHVIDVSDPDAPAEVFAFDPGYNMDDIAASGDLLYVLDGVGGLTVYDFAKPNLPQVAGNLFSECVFTNSITRSRLAIEGGRMVISGLLDLELVSVADPENPVSLGCVRTGDVIGSFRATGRYADPTLAGGVLYLRDTEAGIVAIDWTDPAGPVLKGQQDTPGESLDLGVAGSHLLIADRAEGIGLVDAAALNLVQPLVGVAWDPEFEIDDGIPTAVENGYSFQIGYDVFDGALGLRVFDVSNPGEPLRIGTYANDYDDLVDIEVRGGFLFLATGSDGLEVVDARDPANPMFLHRYRPMKGVQGLAMGGDLLALLDDRGMIVVLDVSYPELPTLEAVVYSSVWFDPAAVVLEGRTLLISGDSGDDPVVEAIDFSDPLRPVSTVSVVPVQYEHVAVDSGFLYGVNPDEEGGLFIAPVADPAAFVRTPLRWFNPTGLAASAGRVVVSGEGGLRLYNTAGATQPATLIGSVVLHDIPFGVRIVGPLVYANMGGVEIVNLGSACGPCPADFNGDGLTNYFDVAAFIDAYNAGDVAADYDGNGLFSFFDIAAFLNTFNAGCP